MNKTYAMLLVLTLGAPAAAELAAPELPFIDAAVVRSQPFEKESINIGAAFPGLQVYKFTGAPKAAGVCEKCGGDYRGAKDERAYSQDQASAREIISIAKRADSPFGGVEDGNLGLSAYRLTPEAANMTVKLVKKAFPGINLGNRKYAAAGPQMVLVITSDDEAYVHMYDQDPYSGKLTRIEDFNSVDAAEAFYGDAQLAALATGYTKYDWTGVLQGLAGKGRGTPLPLGQGSARPYWWAN